MDRFHFAIVTTAICALQAFGARNTLGQGQAQLFDDLETGHATREKVDVHGPSVLEAFGRVPLAFIENRGQFDERVCFVARQGGVRAYFTRDAFVLQLVSRGPHRPSSEDFRHSEESSVDEERCGANVFLTFEGASRDVVVEGIGALPGHYNYFVGNAPSKWCTQVPAYTSIGYRGLYPGIDLVVRDRDGRLEYDVVLGPGADAAKIVVRCEGAESLRIDEVGSLVLDTAAGQLVQPRPMTYQVSASGDREPLECTYCLLGADCFGFEVPSRASERSLVIDPGLVYSTFLGGSGLENGTRLAVDATGAALVVGYTLSSGFPTTPGAYDTTYNGGGAFEGDAFVAKLSADGKSLVYSTFLGGSSDDGGMAISVDATGAALIIGNTLSSNFPATTGAYDTTYNGGSSPYFGDVFVAKLNPDGSNLLFATFLGGSSDEIGTDIAVAATGASLVTGYGYSSDFPTTPGAFDTTYNGNQDAFVAQLSADGSSLVYSTFLGGSGIDYGFGIAVDATAAAFISGSTGSSDFPTTPGAFDTTQNGDIDAFVAKLSADGSSLLYSTFQGGGSYDSGGDPAIDGTGAVLVTGNTFSASFPTTAGAYDTTFNGFNDGYVAKLSADGSSLLYSTLVGGSNFDYPNNIAVDATGAAFVVGETRSSDFPTTPGAYDTTYNGGSPSFGDAFVFKLSADGTTLLYSTFLGGSSDDLGGSGIALDATGAILVNGSTYSSNFPTTPGAYDTTYNGDRDAFAAKLSTEGSDCSGDPGFTLTVPAEAPIGEFIDICTSAPGGDLVALVGSLGQGPTVTPFGTLCLDFPPLVLFTFVMPGGGSRCFHRSIACVPDLVGVTGYLQFIALTPGGDGDGVSNQSPVTVVDHGACG